jgi:hypothetical protein
VINMQKLKLFIQEENREKTLILKTWILMMSNLTFQ